MLPGLRFLFAAIVLATSLLVFGLGAAALFRAAHEEFASIPARMAPPAPQFAQQPETPPVLAMVRVDPSAAADKVAADTPAASTPSEPAASESAAPAEVSPPAEPEKVAAAKADDPSAPPEPEAPATETPAPALSADVAPQPPTTDFPPASQPTPAATEPSTTEAKVAAVADPPAATSEPPPAAPAPAMAVPEPSPPPSPEAIAAATKIATLGGPEVVVDAPAAPKAAEAKKPERNASGKPTHRKERRRIVRARPVRQVMQQQIDPFGQTTLVPVTRR
ncbi:hypothetical protein ABIB82_000049 [Bradyrhizobium sp. i1.8.4]|uniref:hypothetical protein n=1 Tax=unclassified Bradyrhizobium TaxID=2631580 RepID=UPI003D20ED0F